MNRILLLLAALATATCSGSPKATCVPGQSTACVGAGGCSGGQVCADDGTRYLACQCGSPAGADASTPVCPPAACSAGADCLALANNSGTTSSLRLSQVGFTAPAALSSTAARPVFGDAFPPHLPACGLSGTGWASWLLQLDSTAQTLKLGAAKPTASPEAGYTFVSESATPKVVPFVYSGVTVAADGAFSTPKAPYVALPIYLDAAGSTRMLLLLHDLTLSGKLSASHNCVGSYLAAGLNASGGCVPDQTHPAFSTGGAFNGYFYLEETDVVIVAPLAESLCVLLSGDPALYGDGANPKTCKRTNGRIDFQGDFCSTGTGCGDSVQVSGSWAASAVAITN